MRTDKRDDHDQNVDGESKFGGNEEVRDGTDEDDDRRDGDGEKKLRRENAVDLPDERPAKFRTFNHRRIEGRKSRNTAIFNVSWFPARRLGLQHIPRSS